MEDQTIDTTKEPKSGKGAVVGSIIGALGTIGASYFSKPSTTVNNTTNNEAQNSNKGIMYGAIALVVIVIILVVLKKK